MKRETFYPKNIGLRVDAATKKALAGLAKRKRVTVPALIREIVFDALITKRFLPTKHQARLRRGRKKVG